MTTTKTLPHLNAELLKTQPSLNSKTLGSLLPEKVLQFGEGNFLRGFVDWMIHGMNQKGLFGGSVVVVQPVAQGLISKLNEQNGIYTLLMRGVLNGKVVEEQQVITSVSRGVDPYLDFEGYLKCAHNPDLRLIVSNTTEAGIAYDASDRSTNQPPNSYPGKLTLLLLERYKAFRGDAAKGFIILPCELIERNGELATGCRLHRLDYQGEHFHQYACGSHRYWVPETGGGSSVEQSWVSRRSIRLLRSLPSVGDRRSSVGCGRAST
jgi:mannitol-1-phosphate/altronate dehydrogenase